MEQSPRRRDGVAIFLIGTGTAFAAGNVGPVVPELASDFDLSLAGVGLLSGTVFFGAMIFGIAFAPKIAERIGVVPALRLACVLAGIGSLIFALSPDVTLLAVGRVISGIGLGLVGTLGPVFGRETGGVARVGVFGASFQFGIGAGLASGSLLADLDVDWRVGFLVSALVGVSALPLLRGTEVHISLSRTATGFLGKAVRSARVWRLAALFIAMFTVPLLLGAWLVHYLTEDGDIRLALAGALSFVMFGASALLRSVGADLAARGTSPLLLRAFAPLLATIGVGVLSFSQSFAVALFGVIFMAAGFALPYAVMIVAAQKQYPREPADPVALYTTLASTIPIFSIPLFGSALSSGHGEEALLGIAIFIGIAGLLQIKPADRPLEPAAPEAA
jgi:MFS family permease